MEPTRGNCTLRATLCTVQSHLLGTTFPSETPTLGTLRGHLDNQQGGYHALSLTGNVAFPVTAHQNARMTAIILGLLAIGFFYFIGTAPQDMIQFALAGVWALMAVGVVVSIAGVLLFG